MSTHSINEFLHILFTELGNWDNSRRLTFQNEVLKLLEVFIKAISTNVINNFIRDPTRFEEASLLIRNADQTTETTENAANQTYVIKKQAFLIKPVDVIDINNINKFAGSSVVTTTNRLLYEHLQKLFAHKSTHQYVAVLDSGMDNAISSNSERNIGVMSTASQNSTNSMNSNSVITSSSNSVGSQTADVESIKAPLDGVSYILAISKSSAFNNNTNVFCNPLEYYSKGTSVENILKQPVTNQTAASESFRPSVIMNRASSTESTDATATVISTTWDLLTPTKSANVSSYHFGSNSMPIFSSSTLPYYQTTGLVSATSPAAQNCGCISQYKNVDSGSSTKTSIATNNNTISSAPASALEPYSSPVVSHPSFPNVFAQPPQQIETLNTTASASSTSSYMQNASTPQTPQDDEISIVDLSTLLPEANVARLIPAAAINLFAGLGRKVPTTKDH